MELRDGTINLQEEVQSACDKWEESITEQEIKQNAMSIAVKSYMDFLHCWIITQPPRWRFIKRRKWRANEPKMEDYMETANQIAEMQISLNKSLKNSE